MANTFTRKLSRLVGTTATTVGSYTVPSSTTVVLVTGDQLQVQSSAATSIDAVMSIMEIT